MKSSELVEVLEQALGEAMVEVEVLPLVRVLAADRDAWDALEELVDRGREKFRK